LDLHGCATEGEFSPAAAVAHGSHGDTGALRGGRDVIDGPRAAPSFVAQIIDPLAGLHLRLRLVGDQLCNVEF
jgi:hypothetical protein